MSLDISLLGWLGPLVAAPAMFIGARVAIRSLLSRVIVKKKVSIIYTDKNNYKTIIYVSGDDELIKLIDDMTENNGYVCVKCCKSNGPLDFYVKSNG